MAERRGRGNRETARGVANCRSQSGVWVPREPAQDATEERKRMMALLFGETTEEKLANVRALMAGMAEMRKGEPW